MSAHGPDTGISRHDVVARLPEEWFAARREICSERGCWLWTMALSPKGYGWFACGGFQILAHRASYERFASKLAPREAVLHHCDVRRCFHPQHLFRGNHRMNMADMVAKGRAQRGSDHFNSNLTPETVRELRRLFDSGIVTGGKELGKLFNVSRQHALNIARRKFWAHLD